MSFCRDGIFPKWYQIWFIYNRTRNLFVHALMVLLFMVQNIIISYFYVTYWVPSKDDKSIPLSMHIWCKTEKLLDMYQRISAWCTAWDQVPGHYQRWTRDMVSVTFSNISSSEQEAKWSNWFSVKKVNLLSQWSKSQSVNMSIFNQ